MKQAKKIAAFLVTLLLCMGMMSMTVFASALSQDGLEVTLTTEKQEYSQNEEIKASLTVKNNNEAAVTNIALENFVPDGYTLKDGYNSTKLVEALNAGETVVLEVVYVPEPVVTEPVVEKTAVQTADTADVVPFAFTMMIALLVIASVLTVKKLKVSGYLSLFLCIVLAGMVMTTPEPVYASENSGNSVNISTEVTVNGSALTLNGKVTYDDIVIPITVSNLAADKTEFYINTESVITFTADVTGAPEMVNLCNADGIVVGVMNQDTEGKYTLTYTTTSSSVSSVEFYASAGDSVSDKVTVNFVEPPIVYGTASGNINHAVTGAGIEGVTLTVRSGRDNTTGDVISTITTDAEGKYSVELPAGNYTLFAEKEGFISVPVNIIVQAGNTGNQNGTMTPILSGDEFRIVLTWGEAPKDLDSHLVGEFSNDDFHVYYSAKTAKNEAGEVVCKLDRDDTESFGPETVTLTTEAGGIYYYYVYKYSSAGTLQESGANVEVYKGDELVRTYTLPSALENAEDRYWNVFAIVNGEIVDNDTVNNMSDISYADEVEESESTEPAAAEPAAEASTEPAAAEAVAEVSTEPVEMEAVVDGTENLETENVLEEVQDEVPDDAGAEEDEAEDTQVVVAE